MATNDDELIQAAFGVLTTLDMLEDDGAFEALRLSSEQQRRAYWEQLDQAKKRLAGAIHAEAEKRSK